MAVRFMNCAISGHAASGSAESSASSPHKAACGSVGGDAGGCIAPRAVPASSHTIRMRRHGTQPRRAGYAAKHGFGAFWRLAKLPRPRTLHATTWTFTRFGCRERRAQKRAIQPKETSSPPKPRQNRAKRGAKTATPHCCGNAAWGLLAQMMNKLAREMTSLWVTNAARVDGSTAGQRRGCYGTMCRPALRCCRNFSAQSQPQPSPRSFRC